MPDDIIQLFTGKDKFEQILFLDNFYERININKTNSQELEKLLFKIAEAEDLYIKRSVLIILCDLFLSGKFQNNYKILGFINEIFDNAEDDLLTSVAIKYFTLIDIHPDNKFINHLKIYTEHNNSDISSEAFYALGAIEMSKIYASIKKEDLIQALVLAGKYYAEAMKVAENRPDAKFALNITLFLADFINCDVSGARDKMEGLKHAFIIRQMYELEGKNIEFDFMIYKILMKFSSILMSLNQANENQWVDYKKEIRQVISINRLIKKIRLSGEKSNNIYTNIYGNVMSECLDLLYQKSLSGDRSRIEVLSEQGEDVELVEFTNHLLRILPTKLEEKEDHNLLYSLIDFYGKEKALSLYEKVKSNNVQIVSILANIPKKNEQSVSGFITGSIFGQEVYEILKDKLEINLPDYPNDKMNVFLKILSEIIKYVRKTIVGSSKKDFLFLYSTAEGGKGDAAREVDLQDDLFKQLELTNLAHGFEHERAKFVDGGRVDIVFKTDLITIPIELKRTAELISINEIEEKYIAQAQTYVSGYDQVGIFVLMDLNENNNSANANFKDLFNIHHLKPNTYLPIKYPDYVISVVVPGNKKLPSSKSKYT